MAATSDILQAVYVPHRAESMIIVVPDVGESKPINWRKGNEEPWIFHLVHSCLQNASLLAYIYDRGTTRNFSWPELLDQGSRFLEALIASRRDEKFNEFPVQLICVGLGGLVVKEAIRLAYEQPQRFKPLLSVISGHVFIGTPHTVRTDEKSWRTLALIPKLTKLSSKKQILSKDHAERLGKTCEIFEEAEFNKPSFCAYELQDTTTGKRFRKKALRIIGEELCNIRTKEPIVVGFDSDYNTLCNISVKGSAFQSLLNFVKTAITDSQLRIMILQSRGNASMLGGREHDVAEPKTDQETPMFLTDPTNIPSAPDSFSIFSSVIDFKTYRAPQLPCYMHRNHRRNPTFFGREEILEAIEKALLPPSKDGSCVRAENKSLRSYALCGMGGIGKTEIAIEFMFAQKEKFDAIFWLQADNTTKLREGFSHIAVELSLEDPQEAKDQVTNTNIVKHWLANPFRHPNPKVTTERAEWLLVLDNADNLEDLKNFWPQDGQGAVLITSRNPRAKESIYHEFSGTDLSCFSDLDAAEFLLRRTQQGRQEPAVAVARKLGGYPLGLIQMSAIINHMDYTFEEFLLKYDEKGLGELLRLKPGWQPDTYVHTVASVWTLDRLDKQSSSLLDVMSLLDPDGIPEELFIKGAQDIQLDDYPKYSSLYEKTRVDLTNRSLITRNRDAQEVRIHRVTQDAIRARMDSEHLRKNFNCTVTLLSAIWPYAQLLQRHLTTRWQICESLISHVSRLYELFKSFQSKFEFFSAESTFARLLVDAAWYLSERCAPDNIYEFLELAEDIAKSQQENMLPVLSELYYARGAYAAETNNLEVAYKSNISFLNLRIEISQTSEMGRRDPLLAQAYNQAANAHMDRAMISEAIELYEQSIAVFKSLDGFSEPVATIVIANLGTAFWLKERYEDASNILTRNLKAREEEFGKDDTQSFRTGRILHVLGNVRASQGKMNESFNYHNRALRQYRASVGDNHHRTADLCCKVSQHYIRLGQISSAQTLLDQAMRIYESRSHFQPELARTLYLMGKVYRDLNDLDKASKAQAQAMAIYQHLRPEANIPDEQDIETAIEEVVCFASR